MNTQNFKTLNKSIKKIQTKRVQSYAVQVADAQDKAEDAVLRAEMALADAQSVLTKQRKAMKRFKNTGDVKHLKAFGVK